MRIGIVGHGKDKFTPKGKEEALRIIMQLLYKINDIILVSGHSPVGGIDIWAEETAIQLGVPLDLKIPEQYKWDAKYGYKQRNLDIAKDSDEVHVILVKKYPPNYRGMTFNYCYHCNTKDHIKSGACWTAKEARKLEKKVIYHLIEND